jgi:DNA adenine methylase
MTVNRPALRYFGGKFRLAPWIIGFFPEHLTYVEPFGGGGSVLLCKEPSYNEVYNDLDSELVNFFRVLRERTEEFIQAVQLTPYSREEQHLAFDPTDGVDDFERARRLYVRSWQSHGGGRTQWRTGWRYEKRDKRGTRVIDDWNKVKHLEAVVNRLKNVQIENDDATRVIKRFDTPQTLFYLDPPYLPSTRSIRWRKKAYAVEMTEEEHVAFIETIKNVQGMVVISGKPSKLYEEMLAGWSKSQRVARTDFQSSTTEVLWLSPNAENNHHQMRLKL